MPAGKFWLAFILSSGFSLLSLWGAKSFFAKARLIEDMPTSRIRSASQGFVELIGLATSQGTLLSAPLSAQPCLWWRYKIERYQQNGKSSSWSTIDKGVSKTPFFMDDGSGICRIEPDGAEVSCLHRQVWYGSTRLPDTAVLAVKPGFFNRLEPLFTTGRYRYSEYLIRDGDPLYLLGHFVSDASGRRVLSIDQVVSRVIRHWKADFKQLLVRFDADGNGVLDETEWQAVRVQAEQEAKKLQAAQAREEVEHALVKPQDSDLPFLIGSHGQEHLSRKFRWQAAGAAALFLATGTLATWLFNSRFVLN